MKRLLMRAAMSPLSTVDVRTMICKNTIAGNSGNMLFPYSLYRTLMVEEETQIDTICTNNFFSTRELGEINEKYDAFIIPLANAFRTDFVRELKILSKMVDGLSIPCVVAGVGVQASVDGDFSSGFEFDEASKRFVRSILRKSAIVGVRGDMTAEYLKRLGFAEERDFTVIGCPSLYMFGPELPKPKAGELTTESMVCMNRKPPLSKRFHNFMNASMKKLPNHYFLPQNLADISLLYAGVPLSLSKHKSIPKGYPQLPSDPQFMEDRVRAFTNVPEWMKFLGQAQFSFGSRIHGNIAAVVSGTPSYIFACDSRVRELAEYHNIPHMLMKDMEKGMDIFDIYEKADFNSVLRGHGQRFAHYADFLVKNGLEHVFDGRTVTDVLPFDAKVQQMDLHPPIHSLFTRPYEEQADILSWYDTWITEELEEAKNQLNRSKGGSLLGMAKKAYSKVKGGW